MILSKILYDKLVIKVSVIDTKIPSTSGLVTARSWEDNWGYRQKDTYASVLVKKIDYNTKITESENKVTSFTGFSTTTVLNTKVTVIVNKILGITNLATKAVLNTKAAEVESKIRDIKILATKAALNTKSQRLKKKYLIPQVWLLLLNLID